MSVWVGVSRLVGGEVGESLVFGPGSFVGNHKKRELPSTKKLHFPNEKGCSNSNQIGLLIRRQFSARDDNVELSD
jgi:hypothetical protein